MKTMLSSATIIVGGLFARPASAREVEYQAPPGCPPGAQVKATIERSAPEGSPAHISVVRDDLLFRGEVVVGEGDGRLKRTVTAKTCDAVVDALTLVVSLYRDPAESPTETLASTDAPAPPAPYPAEPDRREPSPKPAALDMGIAAAGTATAFMGTPVFGARLYGELTLHRKQWEPSARLALDRTFEREVGDRGVNVVFTTASLEACPLAFGGDVSMNRVFFRASVCARGDVGTVQASFAGEEDTRRWSVVGSMLHTRLTFGRPDVPQPFVELGAGILAPLTRHRYHVDSRVDAVPAMQSTVALAVGVVLP